MSIQVADKFTRAILKSQVPWNIWYRYSIQDEKGETMYFQARVEVHAKDFLTRLDFSRIFDQVEIDFRNRRFQDDVPYTLDGILGMGVSSEFMDSI